MLLAKCLLSSAIIIIDLGTVLKVFSWVGKQGLGENSLSENVFTTI